MTAIALLSVDSREARTLCTWRFRSFGDRVGESFGDTPGGPSGVDPASLFFVESLFSSS